VSSSATFAAALSRLLGSPVCLPLGPVIEAPVGGAVAVAQALALGAPPGMILLEEEEEGGETGSGTGAGAGGEGERGAGVGGGGGGGECMAAEGSGGEEGSAGERVLPSDASQLQCMPLRPFHRDEVIARRQPQSTGTPYGPGPWRHPPGTAPAPSPGLVIPPVRPQASLRCTVTQGDVQ